MRALGIRFVSFAIILILPALAVAGEVYSCKQDGKLIFQGTPCPIEDNMKPLCAHPSRYYQVEIDNKGATSESILCLRQTKEREKGKAKADFIAKQKEDERDRRLAAIQKDKADKLREETVSRKFQAVLKANALREAIEKGGYLVEYLVLGGSGKVSLTYTNEDGGTEQHDVSLPWYKYIAASSRFHGYISAQNSGFGSITVQILVNDKVVKESSSSSEYGIASASILIP